MKKSLMISGGSPVNSIAGSIVKTYEEGYHDIECRAIGASAVNQMVKAVATARGIFGTKGLDLSMKPGYDKVEIDGVTKTLMIARLEVK